MKKPIAVYRFPDGQIFVRLEDDFWFHWYSQPNIFSFTVLIYRCFRGDWQDLKSKKIDYYGGVRDRVERMEHGDYLEYCIMKAPK